MSISHTAHATVNEARDEIDLETWLFGLSDADYFLARHVNEEARGFAAGITRKAHRPTRPRRDGPR